jgi:hypothetical protein
MNLPGYDNWLTTEPEPWEDDLDAREDAKLEQAEARLEREED